MKWHSAYIALGSNLGDRKSYLVRAIDALSRTPGVVVGDMSSLHETAPVDVPAEDGEEPGEFINAVVAVRTTIEPVELLRRLRKIEHDMGRMERHEKNASRTLDLDLLVYGEVVMDSAELTLPHPRMHMREFVLRPLAEIAPELVLPGRTATVAELLSGLDSVGN